MLPVTGTAFDISIIIIITATSGGSGGGGDSTGSEQQRALLWHVCARPLNWCVPPAQHPAGPVGMHRAVVIPHITRGRSGGRERSIAGLGTLGPVAGGGQGLGAR